MMTLMTTVLTAAWIHVGRKEATCDPLNPDRLEAVSEAKSTSPWLVVSFVLDDRSMSNAELETDARSGASAAELVFQYRPSSSDSFPESMVRSGTRLVNCVALRVRLVPDDGVNRHTESRLNETSILVVVPSF